MQPDPELLEAARKLFAGEADFIWAADKIDGLPPIARAEIAFAGRSNVGKSSLINAVTGRNALARTSHTPGRTQQLNFFDVAGRFRLVDMPGYGLRPRSPRRSARTGPSSSRTICADGRASRGSTCSSTAVTASRISIWRS